MSDKRNQVIHHFIQLTEQIANGKTHVLNFGSEDMTFYRGEIHMLKLVGDDPGIFISEMARKFNITRAVVAKTIRKLEERGFLTKEEDIAHKKRLRLFLTEKGAQAYKLHDAYHKKYDRPLFDYIDGLNDHELQVLHDFFQHAENLIKRHF